jgi:hypothetical protein
MKIHNVFHPSFLDPTVPYPFYDRVVPPAPVVKIAGQEEYEVEKNLDSQLFRRHGQYLVK